MRHTSFRRRSGMRIAGDLSRLGESAGVSWHKVPLLDADDPDGIDCHCGVRVRRLTCGRPVAHAPEGWATSAARGLYKCEGSGSV